VGGDLNAHSPVSLFPYLSQTHTAVGPDQTNPRSDKLGSDKTLMPDPYMQAIGESDRLLASNRKD